MKKIILFSIYLLFYGITSVFAGSAENLIGTWAGKCVEFNGTETISVDYSITLNQWDGQYFHGEIKYENFSNGKANDAQTVKVFYSNNNGTEGIVFDQSAYIQNTKKKSKGNISLIILQSNGRQIMKGGFVPDKATDNADVIHIELMNTSVAASKTINGRAHLPGPPKQAVIPPSGNVIHMAADPVIVDGDELYNFNNGYAIVRKGSAYCIIDKEGKIVVPYNKYNYYYNSNVIEEKDGVIFLEGMQIDRIGFVNGCIGVQDPATKLWGMLNNRLKLIIPCKYDNISPMHDDGYVRATTPGTYLTRVTVSLDKNGKVVLTGPKVYNTMGLTVAAGPSMKYGYCDNLNKLIIPYAFDRAMPFSEGLAAVGKNDEYGKLKWGFINTAGKLVIPYTFTNQPGDFHNNLAFVEPVVKDDFEYAYIDRQGQPAIKIKREKDVYLMPSGPYLINNTWAHRPKSSFLNGYAIWYQEYRTSVPKSGTAIMDTSGNYAQYFDLLQQHGWPTGRRGNTQTEFINNEAILSSGPGVKYDEIWAIANIKGEIIVTTTYKEGSVLGMIYSLFDPVSGLARVMEYDKTKTTNGYCDRNGEIKIILKPIAKW